MACSLAPMASLCLPTHGLQHPSNLAFSLCVGRRCGLPECHQKTTHVVHEGRPTSTWGSQHHDALMPEAWTVLRRWRVVDERSWQIPPNHFTALHFSVSRKGACLKSHPGAYGMLGIVPNKENRLPTIRMIQAGTRREPLTVELRGTTWN
jgi:hypothetical protein